MKLLGERHHRDGAIGSDDHELAALECDVGWSRFEDVAGKLFAFLDDFGRAFDDGGAAMHDRFGSAGAAAYDDLIAISLH